MGFSHPAEFPMDRGRSERRTSQRETFGELAQVVMQPPAPAAIGVAGADKACQAAVAVAADPSLRRPRRHRSLRGNLRQRCDPFEMGPQLAEAFERELTLRLDEFGQHWGCRWARANTASYDNSFRKFYNRLF